MSEDLPKEKRLTLEVAKSKELLDSLTPEAFVDNDGISRTVFTFKNSRGKPIKVVFYGREEMPLSDELFRGRHLFVLGDNPKWRKNEDWEQFKSRISEHKATGETVFNPGVIRADTIDQGSILFLVEQSPRALLDMAFFLGAEDKELRESRLFVSQGRTTDRIENLIDQVIAAKILTDENEFKDGPDNEGEALLLLALAGNSNAANVLEQKRMLLEAKDRERKAVQLEEERRSLEKSRAEALKPEELVAVHLTRYMPRVSEDKADWELETTFEATKRKEPRITQHFTLNHPVVSAGLYGNWEDAPIALLTPFEEVVAKNGNPAGLNTVDTFWEVSPGRRTELPKESTFVVRPGKVNDAGKLFEQSGHKIIYKNKDLIPEDIALIAKSLDKHIIYIINQRIRRIFQEAITVYDTGEGKIVPAIPEDDFYKIAQVFGATKHDPAEFAITGVGEERRNLLPDLFKKPIEEIVKSIFNEADVKIGTETVAKIARGIEREFIFRIKKLVIEQQIRNMGYKVHCGGMWAWDGDSWEATEQTRKLGLQMGVWVGPHSSHESSRVEDFLSRSLYSLKEGEETPAEYRFAMRHLSDPKFFMRLSQPMRRMLYEMGNIVSFDKSPTGGYAYGL